MKTASTVTAVALGAVTLAACGLDSPLPHPYAGAAPVAALTAGLVISARQAVDRLSADLTTALSMPPAAPAAGRLAPRVACADTATDGKAGTPLTLPVVGDGSLPALVALAVAERLPAARLRVPCAAPDLSYLDARFGESR